MELVRYALHGAIGGALAAALLGLVEAIFLQVTTGAPEFWAFPYALVLYGLIGLPIGFVVGLLVGFAKRFLVLSEERALANGAIGAFIPMGGFILRYLANKSLYAEQGVPLAGNLGILAVIAAISLLALLAIPPLVRGPFTFVRSPLGFVAAWGLPVLVALGAAVAFPAVDGRAHFATHKPLPAGLASKPNVLFVMVDTLRADHLGAYGAENARTPALDAFAKESVVFEHAFSNASWTRASGASLFTSRLPSGHNAALKASRLPDEVVTFAEVMQPAGVATGALVNNINLSETFNFDQGFDAFYYESPEYRFGATESVFGLTFYKVVQKVAERVMGGHKQVESYYQPADVVLGDAKSFIDANKDGRWALYVHLMEPHDPYFEHPSLSGGTAEYNGVGFARAEVERPDPADAAHIHDLYRGEVAFLDTKIAPFLEWMRSSGVYDNTLIVFTADHGEEFYEHGGFWHGTTLYDEQVHVPLIIKLPKGELAGTRVGWQVSSIDVAPTLVGALGLPADASWEGTDLRPVMDGWLASLVPPPAVPVPAPVAVVRSTDPDQQPIALEPVLAEVDLDPTPDPCLAVVNERPIVAEEDFEGNQLASIRLGGFKYIRANDGNPRGLPTTSLFHVAADAAETTNLSGTTSAICGAYPESQAKQLDGKLGEIIVSAHKGSASGGNAKIDAAECERLKALGYMDPNTECQ